MSNPQIEIEDGFTRTTNEIDLNGGWIRLYRKTLFSAVFQNETLLKVWIWCLLRACHSAQTVSVKTGRGETLVNLQPGQFIFGRNSASKELKLPASTVRNKISQLEKMGNLSVLLDSHYSIVSITRWDIYQSKNWTGKGQAKDRQTQNLGQATGQANSDDKKEKQDRQLDRQKNEHPENLDTNNNTISFKERYRKKERDKSLDSLFSEIESDFKPEDLLHKEEFLDYWTEKNPNGKKERWQMEKVFDVKRRYQTWLRNYKRWTGQLDADRKAEEMAEALKYWGQNNA